MSSSPDPGAWPLSAPATALLRDPATAPPTLLRLALRELVVRGAVRVQSVDEHRMRAATVALAPGDGSTVGLPPALQVLAEALLPHLDPAGTPAAAAVAAASGWRADLPPRVRDAARQELRTAGLLVEQRSRLLGVLPRTRWELTPSGHAWARSATDVAAAAAVLPATGLLLTLDEEVQRRLRDSVGADGHGSVTWDDGDVEALDTVLGDAGPALDSAADAGSGGSGDGGDGGGGGGGD